MSGNVKLNNVKPSFSELCKSIEIAKYHKSEKQPQTELEEVLARKRKSIV